MRHTLPFGQSPMAWMTWITQVNTRAFDTNGQGSQLDYKLFEGRVRGWEIFSVPTALQALNCERFSGTRLLGQNDVILGHFPGLWH